MMVEAEERTELQRVMKEVTRAMDGQAAALSIHPDDERAPDILFYDDSADLTEAKVSQTLARMNPRRDNSLSDHQWIEAPAAGFSHALSVSVQRVPGFSRLMITIFFDRMSAERLQIAEAAYLQRRPFAVGYFRLWQLNQKRLRHTEALEAALDLNESGVVLLDGDGAILFANRSAETLLAAGEGIRRDKGAIAGTQRKEALALRAAIDHVILARGEERSVQPIISLKRRSAAPLLVTVLPPRRLPADPEDVAAIVYMLDPEIDMSQLFSQLRQLYELTPVEARLACLLVEGRALAEAAAEMRIKEQTARSCLKQIFAKTQTHRQADLVRVALSNLVRTSRAKASA